ncbi:unnamed protein product [Paramecium pentaurelia]|uniref:Uncharacterized protein n=1 Tax=Paramecium pentaurelia TaxID=43138 RepID=A0A8S1VWM5_9CILI|nr:unnamed protein product [Paramecium pentaurelia]
MFWRIKNFINNFKTCLTLNNDIKKKKRNKNYGYFLQFFFLVKIKIQRLVINSIKIDLLSLNATPLNLLFQKFRKKNPFTNKFGVKGLQDNFLLTIVIVQQWQIRNSCIQHQLQRSSQAKTNFLYFLKQQNGFYLKIILKRYTYQKNKVYAPLSKARLKLQSQFKKKQSLLHYKQQHQLKQKLCIQFIDTKQTIVINLENKKRQLLELYDSFIKNQAKFCCRVQWKRIYFKKHKIRIKQQKDNQIIRGT